MHALSPDEERGEAGIAVGAVPFDNSLPCTLPLKSTFGKLSTYPKIAQSNQPKVQADLGLRRLYRYGTGLGNSSNVPPMPRGRKESQLFDRVRRSA